MKRTADCAIDEVRSLAASEFDEIRRLAHRSFGLDLRDGKEELVSARLRRLVGSGNFHSFREYCHHVLADRTGDSLAAMIDALATNHTSFLREPDHFEFLRKEVLPSFAGREGVELWSAACSTGEEVWTLACVMNDALPARRIRISASDISNKALRVAAQGVYSAERCKELPAAWLKRYFVAAGRPPDAYQASPELRQQARFQRLNLIERLSWPRQFAAIFCRNVMIYFDRPTQEQVVNKLAECLEPGGYLFVGHAESLSRVTHTLEYVRPAIYRKPGKRGAQWPRS
ncbi:MAG: protein-glutamate O-methyltransferase CheR [Candidatus Sulfopaludibacter sp.]|nr:protein-glutamate O-methyltransferase CheR [Candidatus Sulfopaludibacter sp.]